MAPLLRGILNCWMCGKPVSLEGCKVDECGNTVHEDCYVAKLAPRKRSNTTFPVYKRTTDS